MMTCKRCGHVLADQDELGWYYQFPVQSPEMPGFTFMDRAHRCPTGELHIPSEEG